MNDETLKNIWEVLTEQEVITSDFDTWMDNFSRSEEVQANVHEYLLDKEYIESDYETWSTNIGVKKKRRFSTHWGRGSYGIRYRSGGRTWLIGAFRSRTS